MPSGFWPAITRRAAAFSVAPIASAMGAPCVLASLGARDPEFRQHFTEGALDGRVPAVVDAAVLGGELGEAAPRQRDGLLGDDHVGRGRDGPRARIVRRLGSGLADLRL